MAPEIREKLLHLNQEFYQKTALNFSASRNYFWAGWDQFLPILKENFDKHHQLKTPYKILDLGCGNARLATFLAPNLSATTPWQYLGWDNSSDLLHLGQEKIIQNIIQNRQLHLHPHTTFILDQADLNSPQLEQQLIKEKLLNTICLFGVLHHLPGQKNRLQLLHTLSRHLQPQGLLIFSLWQFMHDPRLAKKIIIPTQIDPEFEHLEPGDQILDWQRGITAYRYCHHFSHDEVEQIITDLTSKSATQLVLRSHYQADGPEGNPLNTYLIFQKK